MTFELGFEDDQLLLRDDRDKCGQRRHGRTEYGQEAVNGLG